MFVFDVFEFAKSLKAMEISRTEEFAPLKNSVAEPSDNPITCREALSKLHKSWVEKAGGKFTGTGEFEVSTKLSYDGENLEKLVKGKTINLPCYLS